MGKPQDNNTRYFIDLDLKAGKILGWDYAQRQGLAQELPGPSTVRVFITKGQYNKLEKQHSELAEPPKQGKKALRMSGTRNSGSIP